MLSRIHLRRTRTVRLIPLLLAAMAALALAASPPAAGPAPEPAASPRGVRDVLGVTHVAGAYHLTEKDFLNEGADQILALGSRVIKLYLADPPRDYPFNTSWQRTTSLVEVAKSAPYRALFEKPFTTYIMTTYSVGRGGHYWRKGVSEEARAAERRQFRDLTRHFIDTYRGTGKKFILQHWEGDWALRGNTDPKTELDPVAIRGMIDWLNARQDGVEMAREDASSKLGGRDEDPGVRVYHATEVNLVVQALRGERPGVVDKVLPQTRLDLVSYSAWDAQEDPKKLEAALDFIEKNLPRKEVPGLACPVEGPAGVRRVYIGEFGAPENDFDPRRVESTVRGTIETGLRWGCPWIVYWQIYCNEPRRRPVAKNDDVRGFCLIRPDGTRTWAWGYLSGLLEKGQIPETEQRPMPTAPAKG